MKNHQTLFKTYESTFFIAHRGGSQRFYRSGNRGDDRPHMQARWQYECSKNQNVRHFIAAKNLSEIDGQSCLEMERIEGIPLSQCFGKVTQEDLPHFITEMSEALSDLHRHKMYHGAVHSDNILRSPNGHFKLYNLGWSGIEGLEPKMGYVNNVHEYDYQPYKPSIARDCYNLSEIFLQLLSQNPLRNAHKERFFETETCPIEWFDFFLEALHPDQDKLQTNLQELSTNATHLLALSNPQNFALYRDDEGILEATDQKVSLLVDRKIDHYLTTKLVQYSQNSLLFEAMDESNHRKPVYLKFLSLGLQSLTRINERKKVFNIETEFGAKLDHPHIAKILGNGKFLGHPYLVVERLDAISLSSRVERPPWPDDVETLRIANHLAEALTYIHGQGVVHGGLQLSNILVNLEKAWLFNFGMARQQGNHIHATPDHIPSQLQAKDPEAYWIEENVTHLTDLYQFGIILYQLLSRKKASELSLRQESFPPAYTEFLALIFDPNKKKRPQTAKDLVVKFSAIFKASGFPLEAHQGYRVDGKIPEGTMIGGFRIEAYLGEFGQIEHYRVRKDEASFVVRIPKKCSQVDWSSHAKRFNRESKTSQLIESNHVIKVLERGQSPEYGPYLILEHVEGPTLETFLHQNDLSKKEQTEIINDLGQAIAAAHKKRIVIQNLSPNRIIMSSKGGLKVFDLGDAYYKADDGSDNFQITPATDYCAPEIKAGSRPMQASGVFAFAMITHKLLTSRLPLNGKDEVTDLAPPVQGFAEIFAQALKENKDERLDNIQDFANKILQTLKADHSEQWVFNRAKPELMVKPPKKGRWGNAFALIVIVLCLAYQNRQDSDADVLIPTESDVILITGFADNRPEAEAEKSRLSMLIAENLKTQSYGTVQVIDADSFKLISRDGWTDDKDMTLEMMKQMKDMGYAGYIFRGSIMSSWDRTRDTLAYGLKVKKKIYAMTVSFNLIDIKTRINKHVGKVRVKEQILTTGNSSESVDGIENTLAEKASDLISKELKTYLNQR